MSKKIEVKAIRHGDVILVPVRAVKGDEQKVERIVLAEGEVTGHSHRISDGMAALFKYDDKTYLKVKSKIATLTHEEHKEIKVPSGDYEVIIQKDYTPKGWQKVVD